MIRKETFIFNKIFSFLSDLTNIQILTNGFP